MKKIFAVTIILFIGHSSVFCQGITSDFHWPDGKKAAVCLTYDDGLDCHIDLAVPALDSFNLKGTFFCTGFSSSLHNRLEEWRAITLKGHELGNHSLFHPCDGERFDWVKPEYDLRTYTMSQLRVELYTANTLLQAVDGMKERTYAYTCSDFEVNRVSFVDSIRNMFVAARSDGPIPESIDQVDLHFAPSWGVVDPTGEELINYVKEAEEKGTIAIFMFHSVGGGYLNVSSQAHRELLEYLQANKDKIWTDTFMHVMKYIRENR
jgi:peptidoglycan/xylan/chitin deacetylase (PgdA/CDA1 family)